MRRLILCVLASAVLGALASVSGATGGREENRPEPPKRAVVEPALAERLRSAPPNATIEALVVLDRQAGVAPARPGKRRGDHLREIENELRATARADQGPLLDALQRLQAGGVVSKIEPLWILNGVVVAARPAVFRFLAKRPEVRELRASTNLKASDALASGAPQEPNVMRVRAPDLWSLGYLGQGVVVASLDTGVDATHPDLGGSWRGGTNSWFDPNGEHPSTPTDVNGHGTSIMGVITGGENGGTAVGVAPGAKWIAAKIFNDRGVATTTNIHRAFQWLLDPDGDPTTADAPNVVNNSWSMGAIGCSSEFQLDLHALRVAGILPVFAAGNGGPAGGTSYSPANNPEALAVGESDNGDVVAPESSRGPSACGGGGFPDVVAPGRGIRSTDLYRGYATLSGTSMSASHVSGVLALLLSAFPNLSSDRQESALEQSAVDVAAPGVDNDAGFGRIDALAAYNWLLSAPDFTLAVSPTSVSTLPGGSVGYGVGVGSVNGFAGDVALSVNGLPSGASGSFVPATVSGAGSSQLTVVASASLAPGTYSFTITGTSGPVAHAITASLTVLGAPDFSVSVSPDSASTVIAGTVTYSVVIEAQNDFTGNVGLTLSGLPSGASATFTPATVSGGAGSSQLAIQTTSALGPGTYALSVTGASGSISHSAAVTLTVTPTPDFALTVSPASTTVTRGSSAAYTVSVASIGGFAGSVSLSASGLPFASTASFSRNPINGHGTSTVTIRTASYTTRGTFTFTIAGKGGTLVRKATAKITVG